MSGKPARRPAAPRGLEHHGRAFWRRIVGIYELSEAEQTLLEQACRLLDELETMRAAVDEVGYVVEGSKGQPRAHPLLAEIHRGRLLLSKLLVQLELPDEDGQTAPTPAQRKARNAADARWSRRRAHQAAQHG